MGDDETAQALTVLCQWFARGKCHRLEQVLQAHPEFHDGVVDTYSALMNSDARIGKVELFSVMLNRQVPGLARAIIDYDREANSGKSSGMGRA